MEKPNISVIIPAHNEEDYLPALLRSLRSQDCRHSYEVIVVDNASTDTTAIVARRMSAKVIHEPRLGLPQARETGRLNAIGEILVFLDADMVVPEHYLASLQKHFSENLNVIAVTNLFTFYDGSFMQNLAINIYNRFIHKGQNLLLHLRGFSSQLLGGNFAVRATSLAEVGGFDLDTVFEGDDIGITKKLSPKGNLAVLSGLYTMTSARRFDALGTFGAVSFYFKEFFTHLFN